MEQAVASNRHKDQFFDFYMIDQNRISENRTKINFLRTDLIDYRKID